MLRLVEINSKVKLDKMSTKDSQEFQDAMQAGQKASEAVRADGVNNTRRFSFRCDVEEHAPHLTKMLEYQRLLDVDVTVREASEADAAALSDLECRCPIVMGDTSMTIDRGTDYFAFTKIRHRRFWTEAGSLLQSRRFPDRNATPR
jgi:hypothetical protein